MVQPARSMYLTQKNTWFGNKSNTVEFYGNVTVIYICLILIHIFTWINIIHETRYEADEVKQKDISFTQR